MTAVNGTVSTTQFGGSITDPTKHAQLYQYLEALKTDENGWRKSTDNIITNNLSFLSRGFDNVPIVIFYLKTLQAIDSEVVDRDIQRTKTDQCSDVTAQCLCLDTIAAFVDWIDVELVANDVFVSLVMARLGNNDTSEVCIFLMVLKMFSIIDFLKNFTLQSAVHAVSALIQKGMPASKKLPLVVALADVMRTNQLITVNPNSDYDDVLRAGSLLSALGSVLIDSYQKFKAENAENDAKRCLEALEIDIDSMLLVLDNEDPELSDLIIYTLRSYVYLLKDSCEEEKCTHLFTRIISVCMRRFVMSEELDVDGSGEDEIEFGKYRKELRGLMNSIGSRRADLIIAPLETLVSEVSTSGGGSAMPVARLEAIVQMVHNLVELIPANFVNIKEGWMGRGAQLPVDLLNAIRLDGRSATVHALYFEIACRYERLLMARPQPVIHQVAAAFLDERGIAFRISRVRTRIVYLFCRFVKSHKTVLSPLVSEVISRLAPLLAVSPQADQMLTADDQAFIFEATGTLIVFGELAVEQKANYIGELANTLGERFLSAVSELESARSAGDASKVQIITQFMINILGYCSRLSKAFNNTNSMQACRCVDVYLRLLNLFLGNLTPANAFLLEPVRQLAHRMVVCLNSELLPILPSLMAGLAGVSTDLDSMNHLLILSHQIVAKYKMKVITGILFMYEELFFNFSTRPQYVICYQILLLVSVLSFNIFIMYLFKIILGSTVDCLLEAATHLALSSDQSCQKLALATLAKLSAGNIAWWQRTLRTALEVPSLSHISPTDAGSSVVVHEVAVTLLTLRQAHPDDFPRAVQSLMPDPLGSDLLAILSNYKSRELDKQLMSMYAKIKVVQQQH
uniref:Exportin-T n=1 Tax=Heterorhabditis bacteriophora TaxID=37862 RepID=A0A1I7XDB1_HETBA